MKLVRSACLCLAMCGVLACVEQSTRTGSRPTLNTEGLGGPCSQDGLCRSGQDCISANRNGVTETTCEIICTADNDCPEGYRCNLPPVAEDTLPNVCIQ